MTKEELVDILGSAQKLSKQFSPLIRLSDYLTSLVGREIELEQWDRDLNDRISAHKSRVEQLSHDSVETEEKISALKKMVIEQENKTKESLTSLRAEIESSTNDLNSVKAEHQIAIKKYVSDQAEITKKIVDERKAIVDDLEKQRHGLSSEIERLKREYKAFHDMITAPSKVS